MPILTKDDQRVYFAHIPKTAGSAIYVLFLRNDWSLANVQTGNTPGRIGYTLYQEFGIEEIPFEGKRHGFKRSLQHAPVTIWDRWGPFTDSFAITRHPYARYMSAMKYLYGFKRRAKPFDLFKAEKRESLRQEFKADADAIEPLFQPQHRFLAPKTRIFRYEEDWAARLCETYALEAEELEPINVTRKRAGGLTSDDIAWLDETYAEDFARLAYGTGVPEKQGG